MMDFLVSRKDTKGDSEEACEENENKVVNIDLQTRKKVKIREEASFDIKQRFLQEAR
jgi:hypothetical protein